MARTTPFTAAVPGLENTDGISYDVVGIGNALVDIIAQVENDFLHDQNLVKGSMALIDTDRAIALYEVIGRHGMQTSGGSAANTIAGLASLGADVAFIGKVSDDDLGRVFAHDLERLGVEFHSGGPGVDLPTGRCIIAVTPDAERTMNTYLGVSTHLAFDDVDAELVETGAVLYMEGYLFDRDEAKSAFRRAAERAQRCAAARLDCRPLAARLVAPSLRLQARHARRGRHVPRDGLVRQRSARPEPELDDRYVKLQLRCPRRGQADGQLE